MVMAGLAAFGILYAAQPVLPQIGAEFDVSPGRASLAVSASTGALALAVVPSAALALRFGRVPTMRCGLLLAVLLTALAALAPSFGSLVALRALSGVVLAAVVAVAMGHVGAEVHPSGLGSAMGLYVAGNSFGGVSGRLVTSFVADGTSWRWGMGALALAAAVATAAFWLLVPAPVGAPGAAERARPHAVRELLRSPGLVALVLVPFVLMGGFVAVYNYLSYRLAQQPFSLPVSVVGLVFLAYLAGTASSAVAGRLADRLGRPGVLAASVLVMGAGLALTLPDRIGWVIAGLVLFTAGFFGAHATASGWVPVVAAPHSTRAASLYVCSYYAGSSVFGVLLGTPWARSGWVGVASGVGVLTLVGLLAALVVIAQTRTRISWPSRAPASSSRSSPDQNLPGS
jgi:YNFM family putative membrane transporter